MELELVYNEETREWEQKKEPFITIEVETEEDFEFIGNAIAFYKKHMGEQEKPQTNADRLRAMDDRELSEALTSLPLCRDRRERSECERKGIKCSECIYEWLIDTACYDPDRDFENEPYTRERQ